MIRAADIISHLRALPLVGVDVITNGNVVMVLAPHPDDETLGCGGLITELTAKGRPPVVVVVTDGTGSHPASRSYPPARLCPMKIGDQQ
jgi:LmbE family N-acetylglucosaminyl deacetylase